MDANIQVYIDKIKHFLEVAKEVNYDLPALYAKEPLVMQILAGGAVFVVLMVILSIRKSMRKSAAQSAVISLENEFEDFSQYQKQLQKIVKMVKSLKPEFIERLQENKQKYYTAQLATLQELPLQEKLQKIEEMSKMYQQLAAKVRDEELREFYIEKSSELLEVQALKEIEAYMQNFDFNDEDVAILEDVVTFANRQHEELKENILQSIMDKLQNVDFGSSLNIYTFVQNLNPERLGDIYTYCKAQQDKLFENGETVVAADVLEYLLENNQQTKVLSYIKSLKVPTHLQELYYRFFNKKGLQELDFAFMENPLEISQQYEDYIEGVITENWRDDNKLNDLLKRDFVTRIIGHDRVRIVIERVDQLRNEEKQNEMTKEALETAKEAHKIALEAKELAQKQRRMAAIEAATKSTQEKPVEEKK